MSDPILSLVQKRPDAAVQLLFLHHAGGSSYPYLQLGQQLSAAIEPFCLELSGRGSRFQEPLEADAALTLSTVLAAIRRLALGRDKPLLLFGHSLGAELAFQVASRLRRESPQMNLGLLLSARAFVDPKTASASQAVMSDEEILHLLAQYEGTPPEVLADPDLKKYVIGVMRNDLALLADLCRLPKPVLDLPAQVLGGNVDLRIPLARLSDWQQVLAGPVVPRIFPGGHFYLFSHGGVIPWIEEQARELARRTLAPALPG